MRTGVFSLKHARLNIGLFSAVRSSIYIPIPKISAERSATTSIIKDALCRGCVAELWRVAATVHQRHQVLGWVISQSACTTSLLLAAAASSLLERACTFESLFLVHGEVRRGLSCGSSLFHRLLEVNWILILLLTWLNEIARTLLQYAFLGLLNRFARHLYTSFVL